MLLLCRLKRSAPSSSLAHASETFSRFFPLLDLARIRIIKGSTIAALASVPFLISYRRLRLRWSQDSCQTIGFSPSSVRVEGSHVRKIAPEENYERDEEKTASHSP